MTPHKIPQRRTTKERLRDLPDLAAHIHLRIRTATPGADHAGARRDPATLTPGNLDIIHALDTRVYPHQTSDTSHRDPHGWDDAGDRGLPATLTIWARMIFEDLDGYQPEPTPLPETQTVTTICEWLHTNYPTWARIMPEAAAEFDQEIRDWHTRLRYALGETDPVQLRHRHRSRCGGTIEQATNGAFECINCHKQWTADEMMKYARFHADVTLTEAADQLGIKPGTLRQWKKRDPNFPEPVETRHPARYRLSDIKQHAEQRQAS